MRRIKWWRQLGGTLSLPPSSLCVSLCVWPGRGQYIMADTSRDHHCTMGKQEEAGGHSLHYGKESGHRGIHTALWKNKRRQGDMHCTTGKKLDAAGYTLHYGKTSGGRGPRTEQWERKWIIQAHNAKTAQWKGNHRQKDALHDGKAGGC